MAKKTKAPTKKKAPKQMKLAGVPMDRAIQNPEVEKAAERYRQKRDERMALTEEEAEKKAELEAAMKKHKLEEYVYTADIEDAETGELVPKKLKVSFSEETETTLTVRTVKEKKKSE